MVAHEKDKARRDTRAHTEVAFDVGDAVLLLKVPRPKQGDKLEPPWEGIYRIHECLENDNYRLRDLHNRSRHDVFHVSRLQPAPLPPDDEPLMSDEYKVDSLLDQRIEPDGSISYKVLWHGHPLSQASWVVAEALEPRCWDLILAFEERRRGEKARSQVDQNKAQAARPSKARTTDNFNTSTTGTTPPLSNINQMSSTERVRAARIEDDRGTWVYELAELNRGGSVGWRWRKEGALPSLTPAHLRRLRILARAQQPHLRREKRDRAAWIIQTTWRVGRILRNRAVAVGNCAWADTVTGGPKNTPRP
jgi:hypothetical protein